MLNQEIKETVQIVSDIVTASPVSSLPELSFKHNSVLGNVQSHLSNISTHTEVDSDMVLIETIMKSLDDALQDTENSKLVQDIAEFSLELSKGFQEAYPIIKDNIAGEVSDMLEKIETYVEKAFKRNNLSNLLNDNLDITTDHFDEMNWNGIKTPHSMLNIVQKLNTFTKLVSEDISKANNDIAVHNIVHTKYASFQEIKDIDIYITDENKAFLEHDLAKYLCNKLETKRQFNNYRKNITDLTQIKFHIKKLCTTMVEFKLYLSFLDDYKDRIDSVIYDKLVNNMNIILESILSVQYCCIFYKETLFKDSILINKELINMPVLKKAEKDNITKETLASFLRVFYLEKDLPSGGIKTDQIKAVELQDKLIEINVSIKAKKQIYMKKFLTAAYMKITEESFEHLYDTFNNMLLVQNKAVARSVYNHHVRKQQSNIFYTLGNAEHSLYSIIIETFFEDTIVDSLFDIFGAKISEKLDSKDQISDELINSLDMETAIELVLNFLNDAVLK